MKCMLQREPIEQLFIYHDNTIRYLPNGMAYEFVYDNLIFEKVIEITLSSNTKSVALIICLIAHALDYNPYANNGFIMNVWIMRDGMVVNETKDLLFVRVE